jgi:microcin C transport system substrate-binding protein
VDFALYQQRLEKFEFEMTTLRLPGTHTPGSELLDLLRQQGGKTPRTRATWGIKSPAVDALLRRS